MGKHSRIQAPVSVDHLRGRMQRAVERMIDALDAMDFDADFEEVNEDGGDIQDEPHDVDDEGNDEPDSDREPDNDYEPSLGSIAVQAHESQSRWSTGNLQDLELGTGAPSTTGRRLVAPKCGKPIDTPEFILGELKVDGPLHPQAIAFALRGSCLEPILYEKDFVIAEPVLPKRGELAVIWPAGEGPMIKYLESELEWFFPHNPKSEIALEVQLRMLNPPRSFGISAAEIDRIWRVSKIVPASKGSTHALSVTGFRPSV